MRHINPIHEDKLDSLIRLALAGGCVTEDIEVFDSLDVSHVSFDRRYMKQRSRIIRREQMSHGLHLSWRTLAHVAVFLVVIISVGAITFIGVSGLTERWRKKVSWYEHSFSLTYKKNEDSETEITEEKNVGETTTAVKKQPTHVEECRKPMYIPEDFEERLFKSSKIYYMIDYYVNGEYFGGYTQGPYGGSEIKFRKEGANIYDGKINQWDAIWIEYDNGMIFVLWEDGEYIYSLECYDKGRRDDLLKMAESVQ